MQYFSELATNIFPIELYLNLQSPESVFFNPTPVMNEGTFSQVLKTNVYFLRVVVYSVVPLILLCCNALVWVVIYYVKDRKGGLKT
jgi:hypothetical protein